VTRENIVATVGAGGNHDDRDTVDLVATCAARPSAGSGTPVPQRSLWTIGGLDPQERLMAQVERQAWRTEEPLPTPGQVSMVLFALADHTSLEQARTWDRRQPGHRIGEPAPEDHLWPTSLSVGRWLQAYGDLLVSRVLEERRRAAVVPARSVATAHIYVARESLICDRCDGRIAFVLLDGGKKMAVDVDTDPDGTVAVKVNSAGAIRGRVLTHDRPVVEGTERLHVVHAATCGRDELSPDAARKSDGVVPEYVRRAAAHRGDRDGAGLWEQPSLPTGPIPTVPAAPTRPERTSSWPT